MSISIIAPGTLTHEDRVGNMLASIILVKSSIPHILKAESEQLLEIINMPGGNTEQHIDANRLVTAIADIFIC